MQIRTPRRSERSSASIAPSSSWAQADLAVRVGVSRLWIVLLEKGKSTAQLGLVLRTLDILGITLEVGEKRSSPKSGGVDLSKLLKARTGKGTL